MAHITDRRVSPDIVMLPQAAKQAGYVTIGIDNLAVQGGARAAWIARGFDFYSGFLFKPFSDQSAHLTDRAISFIDEYAHRPFFLFLHLWDPHTPYGPPPPYDTLHYHPGRGKVSMEQVRTPAPEYYDAFVADMKLKKPHDYDWIVAQYDGEISYVDTQIGRLTAFLKERGLWDDTLFVLMSDHGEAFGEGGFYFDHHGVYDAVTRVALMMKNPNTAPLRSRAFVSTEDVFPTLCGLVDWPVPQNQLTGESFAAALSGAQTNRRELFMVEATRQASMAVRTEKWKFIQPIVEDGKGAPMADFHGNPRDPQPLLFDLENDPGETRNLSKEQEQGEICAELSGKLSDWRASEVERRNGDDPLLDGLTLPVHHFLHRIEARKDAK
jgi:arylsulfatase A-like enzyme